MITSWLWPRAAVRHLTEEIKAVKSAHKYEMDRANHLQFSLDAALSDASAARKETVDTLKRMVNTQMLAAGSKATMFEDVGPHPAPRVDTPAIPTQMPGKLRMGEMARRSRANFLEQFAATQFGGAPSEPLPYDTEGTEPVTEQDRETG